MEQEQQNVNEDSIWQRRVRQARDAVRLLHLFSKCQKRKKSKSCCRLSNTFKRTKNILIRSILNVFAAILDVLK